MLVTFEQWANNPMGKQSAVMTNRELIKQDFRRRLDAVMTREIGKLDYYLYYDKDKNTYVIHIKSPSEVVPKFYYDVIVEFSSNSVTEFSKTTLKDYNFRVFSNDPHFAFTYAYAYNKKKLFISELAPRMIKECLTTVAKSKNPKSDIGYDKHIYFAYLHMVQRGLFEKSKYTIYGKPLHYKQLIREITPTSAIINNRQEKAAELNKTKNVKEKSIDKVQKNAEEARAKNMIRKQTVMTRTRLTQRAPSIQKMSKSRPVTKSKHS